MVHFQADIRPPSPNKCCCRCCNVRRPVNVQPPVTFETIGNDTVPASTNLSDIYNWWVNFGSIEGKINKIGIGSRTKNEGKNYTLTSAWLCIKDINGIRPISNFDLEENIPKIGPRRLTNGYFMVPYITENYDDIVTFKETTSIHEAPTWTIQNNLQNSFIFGGGVRLVSCLMIGWAGGGGAEKKYIGTGRSILFKNFILPWDDITKHKKQSRPPNNEYKTLFCLVAKDNSLICENLIKNVDLLRRAWEIYFPLIMLHRGVNTTIDFSL
ncbi:MAG: hypothetical protein V3V33_05390 [Candidatus Lokiarchaeia archaeon]